MRPYRSPCHHATLKASAGAFFVISCLVLAACDRDLAQDKVLRFTGATMGTHYTVKVMDLPAGVEEQALSADIATILEDVYERMSTYRNDSELSRFNASETTDWVAASPELVFVVDAALRVSRLTGGAFDITVGPLVNLWGFGPTPRPAEAPPEQQIREGLAKVGSQHLHTRLSPPAIKKDRGDIYIDLSAIAKGYAVDRVAERLDALGIVNYLVEVGGELRGKGHNAQGAPWKIAIERPAPETRAVFKVISLQDQGAATSGDYRNYFEQDGQRFSHTLDPRTGKPIVHRLASVTVLSSTAMHADAMATALMVLGPEAGFKLAQQEKLAVFFITKTANGFTERSTAAFGPSILR